MVGSKIYRISFSSLWLESFADGKVGISRLLEIDGGVLTRETDKMLYYNDSRGYGRTIKKSMLDYLSGTGVLDASIITQDLERGKRIVCDFILATLQRRNKENQALAKFLAEMSKS